MHHRPIALFLIAVLTYLQAAPTTAAPSAMTARLDAQLETNRTRYGIAGQAVLLARNGAILHEHTSGDADREKRVAVRPDTVFGAYSLAKLFTSTLVMQLVDEGEVALDVPATRYVPNLPDTWKHIHLRDFLNHSSGVPEYFDVRDGRLLSSTGGELSTTLAGAISSIEQMPLYFPPGSRNRYTQTNFLVLTALLEAHYQKPYDTIARERILQPLALRNTWLGVSGTPSTRRAVAYTGAANSLQQAEEPSFPSYAHGHADLQTNVGDMNLFLQALARGSLVRRTTLETLWQPYLLTGGQTSFMSSGWDTIHRDGYTQVGHDGGTRVRVRMAFTHAFEGDIWTVIYFTNGSAMNVWSSTLADSIMAAAAPDTFPAAAVSERLISYAFEGDASAEETLRSWLQQGSGIGADELERAINSTGYGIRDNFSPHRALKVFILNTQLHPQSANAWDSLAECYSMLGDKEAADAAYARSRQLAAAHAYKE